jgi:hypothetical protein
MQKQSTVGAMPSFFTGMPVFLTLLPITLRRMYLLSLSIPDASAASDEAAALSLQHFH